MIKQLFENISKGKTLVYFLLLIAVTTLVYSNHFSNSFHFDDSHTVENNLFIQDIKNIPRFFTDATTFSSLPSNQSYRPFVSTSLAFDYWMGKGYNMFYFHLSSFIFFLLQGILMFFFIFKFLNISYKNNWNFYIAAIAVAWYLLHPANAETINYVIARSDLQSTFFVVLGFVLYMFSPYCKRTHIYLIPIGIGGLAKPTTVMFAPLLFFYILLFEQKMSLYDIFKQNLKSFINIVLVFLFGIFLLVYLRFFDQDKKLDKWIKKIPLLIVIIKTVPSFIFCAVLYLIIDRLTPKTWESGGSSTFNYLITQPFVIAHYFSTFFFPFGLSADSDWEPLQSIWNIRFFIGCAFVFLMLFISFLFSKDQRLRPISYGILWFFLALVPSSSVIPFAEVLNDHRIFFPYVGLVISVCWTIGLLLMKYKKYFETFSFNYEVMVAFFALIVLSGYAFGTYERNKVWNTEESLWLDVTVKSPKNARGLMNYGLSRMNKGDYVEAEKCFTKAIAMWPYYYSLHINMGVLKNATGDKITAERYFKSATQLNGGNTPDTWFFYGNFLCNQLRYVEAIPMLEKCIELSPASIGARSALMKAFNDTGDWDKLSNVAQSTLQIIPDNTEALQYLEASKNKKGKIEMSEEEVKKAPTAEKYFNLGLMYNQAGKYEQAVNAYLVAVKLKPDYADAYNNMGSAYTLIKQYDKAIVACQKAIDIKPDFQLAKNNLVDAINQRDKISKMETAANDSPSAGSQIDLSLSYYQQGEYEKSIEACKKALTFQPDYAAAYSNMGAAYNQLKQWDKAIVACQKAIDIKPDFQLAKNNLNWAKDEKAKSKK